MQVQIRAVKPTDAGAIARLNIQWGYTQTTTEVANRLHLLEKVPEHDMYVAEINGEVVAWLSVHSHFSLGSGTFAEISGLVVDAQLRRKGIARMLVEKAKEWTRANGLYNLKVRTNIKRPEASLFYKGAGFNLQKQQYVFEMEL